MFKINKTKPTPATALVQASPKRPNPKKQRLIIGGLIVLAVAIAAAGVSDYLIHQKSSKPTTHTVKNGAYGYSYSRLDNFRLQGVKNGAGVSFSKPTAYGLIYQAADNSQASFRHSIVKAAQHATIGGIDVASLNQNQAVSSAELNSINTSFSSPASSGYKSAVGPIQQFVSDRIGPLYNLKLTDASKFSSTFVRSGAWSWQFTATPKPVPTPAAAASTPTAPFDTSSATPPPAKPASPNLPTFKGQIIFAVGNHTYYYFLMFNTDYNWDNNSSIWSQVTNSLKLDQ